MMTPFEVLSVFADGPAGGNTAPVVLAADDPSDVQMHAVARRTGFESAFLLGSNGHGRTGRLRFWVPDHEVSMCGHATIALAWLMRQHGREEGPAGYVFDTASGPVRAGAGDHSGWFEQPSAGSERIQADRALQALGLERSALAGNVWNAAAPRVKTLIPVRSATVLDRLVPDRRRVEEACEALGSTGLYPYAITGPAAADARQFPRSSGCLEDPATGIAAAALFFVLVASGELSGTRLVVRQGRGMGRPSRIVVGVAASHEGVAHCHVTGDIVRALAPSPL